MKPLSTSLTQRSRGPRSSLSSLRRLRRTIILLVVTFIVLVSAAATYRVALQYQVTMDAATRSARNGVKTVESHATLTFRETFRILEGVADVYEREREAGRFDEEYLHDLMADKLKVAPAVASFFIADAKFRGLAGSVTYPVNIGLVYLSGMSFEALEDVGGDVLIGQLYKNINPTSATAGAWFVPAGVKIKDAKGEVVGYVVALIRAQYFSDYYASIDVGAHGHIYLWTIDNRLIGSTSTGRGVVGEFRSWVSSVPQQWASGDVQMIGSGSELAREVIARGKVALLPFSASVTLMAEDCLADWRASRDLVTLGVLIMVTVMTVLGALILRQIRRSEEIEHDLRIAKASAEEANDSKSRFLAHMSHEFRTPLNAIMGFSEIIKNKVLGDDISASYTQYAGHIHRSGEHLLNIVNDILDMAKIESGAQPLTREAIDIALVMTAAVSFVEGLANQKEIAIRVAIPGHMPLVSGDQRFSRQVVINLLSNAIKFSPNGSDITVAARHVEGKFLDVTVSDHGPGIEPALLRRLGEPFLQGNPAVSHSGQGTGLGLSICARYMELLGGELLIESAVGSGTRATIRFPQHLLIVPLTLVKRDTAAE